MNDEAETGFRKQSVKYVIGGKSEGLQEDAEKFLPLYISVDKDVLCTEDAQTTWSQGYEADNFGVRCTDCIGMCKRKQWKDCRCGYLRRSRCGKRYMRNEANDYANEKLLEFLKVYLGNPTVNNK